VISISKIVKSHNHDKQLENDKNIAQNAKHPCPVFKKKNAITRKDPGNHLPWGNTCLKKISIEKKKPCPSGKKKNNTVFNAFGKSGELFDIIHDIKLFYKIIHAGSSFLKNKFVSVHKFKIMVKVSINCNNAAGS
jgi:hypothetical protein